MKIETQRKLSHVRPEIDPERLNTETFIEISEKHLESTKVKVQSIKKVCHDQEVIVRDLLFENHEGAFSKRQSQLF